MSGILGGNTDLDPRLDVVPIRLQTVKSAERVRCTWLTKNKWHLICILRKIRISYAIFCSLRSCEKAKNFISGGIGGEFALNSTRN